MMSPCHARLLGALLAGKEAAAARDLTVLDVAGWTALLRAAGEDLLTPEIAVTLATPALAPLVPPEVASHLMEMRALNAERSARIATQAEEMILAFGAAGLRLLLLKGARAFADPDPKRADRVMIDLDLLFPAVELDGAAKVLGRLGYHRLDRGQDEGHAVGYFLRPGEPAAVDLHREPLRLSYMLSADMLLGRARHAAAFGAPVLIADPADEVLQRVLHIMVHHRAYRCGDISVRSLRDIAVRLPGLGPADWMQLRARAAGRALLPLATALCMIEEAFGDDALPLEGAVLAHHPLARAAAWRAMAKAKGVLPGLVNAAWGVAVGGIGAHEHRPGVDGPLAFWWVRRLVGAAKVVRTPEKGVDPS